MRIDVNVNEIKVVEDEMLNKNEYMIHDFYFNFSEEYTNDLVKVALFTTSEGTTYKVLLDIHDSCNIPPEILANEDIYILGVYAYKTEDDELIERFSPSPIKLYVNNGSYIRDEDTENSEPITPSELEQYQQIIENALNEVANVDIDAEKIGDTATVTIINRYGEEKSVSITDGKDGIDGKDAKINGYNTITIEGGENISIEQEDNTLTINNTYEYDDSEIKQDIETIEGNITDINTELGTKVTKDVNNLTYYTLTTQTGSKIQLEINSSTYVLTAKLYDKNNNLISTSTGIDLPLETMVVGASYDSTTKEIVLTLKNGQTIRFSVADLVSGLQEEITLDNKLSADLVDDSTSTNKFVTSQDKTNWNAKVDEEDIADFVKNTDYPTENTSGVVKQSQYYGFKTNENGKPYADNFNYSTYQGKDNYIFIGKGTLENVITGKQLINQTQLEESQQPQDERLEELEEIASNIPTTTGTGESITLDNTMKCKHAADELGGNTDQETTTGHQLLPISSIENSTKQGVTITNNQNGTYELNGTSEGSRYNCFFNIYEQYPSTSNKLFVGGNTYYFNTYSNNDDVGLYILYRTQSSSTDVGVGPVYSNNQYSWECPSDVSTVILRIVVNNQNLLKNVVVKPIVSMTSGATYEKYTGRDTFT